MFSVHFLFPVPALMLLEKVPDSQSVIIISQMALGILSPEVKIQMIEACSRMELSF